LSLPLPFGMLQHLHSLFGGIWQYCASCHGIFLCALALHIVPQFFNGVALCIMLLHCLRIVITFFSVLWHCVSFCHCISCCLMVFFIMPQLWQMAFAHCAQCWHQSCVVALVTVALFLFFLFCKQKTEE